MTEIDQYELVPSADGDAGVVEIVLKARGLPTQSLNDKAFMNPLYGNVRGLLLPRFHWSGHCEGKTYFG